MRPARETTRVLALSLALWICMSAAALGSAPDPGSFSITPADSRIDGRPALSLPVTKVANTTAQRLEVRVFPVLLEQQTTGAFSFDRDPQHLATAARLLRVSVSHLTLEPHSARAVDVKWTVAIPRRSLIAGVVYEAHTEAAPGTLQTIERLLSVNVLTPPGTGPASAGLSALKVGQSGRSQLRFTMLVRNASRRAGTPARLGIWVRDRATGSRRWLPIAPGLIAPGASREFSGTIEDDGRPGDFDATAEVSLGETHGAHSSISYHLGKDGRLPTASLLAGTVIASGVIGGEARAEIPVRNLGTAPAAAEITFSLYPLRAGLPSNNPAATVTARSSTIAAGHAVTLRASLGHLRASSYEIVAGYHGPFRSLLPATVDFQARNERGPVAAALGWVSRNALTLSLAAGLAAALLAIALLVRRSAPQRSHPRDGGASGPRAGS
ncbi:MAG TPA: hypothetical protein VH061_14130 [Solirubrobacteraceae bacterium]|nr:hypothetical protein [Solirubrobacteraceae bacterium]